MLAAKKSEWVAQGTMTAKGSKHSIDAADSEGVAQFGCYVVALVDVLGQASELAKWNHVPDSLDLQSDWLTAVRASMGRVQLLREQFEKRLVEFKQVLMGHEGASYRSAPPEEQRQFNEFKSFSLCHRHFSDTVLFYSPLMNEHGYLQVSSIAGFLVTCGGLVLEGLARKIAFRGAIDVGVLSTFPSGDPYGPALARAHCLESKKAQYPRIVVSPAVVSYLDWIEKQPGGDAATRAISAGATWCRGFIGEDDDGEVIVDYLNGSLAAVGGYPAEWRPTQQRAFEFASNELRRFQNEGNEKLVKRYERLVAYFRGHGSQ